MPYHGAHPEGDQRLLLQLARKRLGEPDAATRQAMQSSTDLNRLDRRCERLREASRWQELLQAP